MQFWLFFYRWSPYKTIIHVRFLMHILTKDTLWNKIVHWQGKKKSRFNKRSWLQSVCQGKCICSGSGARNPHWIHKMYTKPFPRGGPLPVGHGRGRLSETLGLTPTRFTSIISPMCTCAWLYIYIYTRICMIYALYIILYAHICILSAKRKDQTSIL